MIWKETQKFTEIVPKLGWRKQSTHKTAGKAWDHHEGRLQTFMHAYALVCMRQGRRSAPGVLLYCSQFILVFF